MGMDRFGMGRGPEEFGDLGETVDLGLFGKGQIFPVGLAFAGEGIGKILFSGHDKSSC
jgi:hypothetical protein